MNQPLVEQYRRWFEYEKDSHAKAMASLNAVPEALRTTPSFKKALTLMAHVAAARELWLFRMGAATTRPEEFFPEDVRLPDLAARLETIHAAWSAHLERLDDAALARTFDYVSLDGQGFRNTVADVLAQLFGHSWYHRGQIALLIRSIGAEPAITDFVYWTREPTSPAPAAAPDA